MDSLTEDVKRLANDVKLLQYWMCETRRDINIVQKKIINLASHEKPIEYRISTLEEKYTRMDKRMMGLSMKNQEEQCLSRDSDDDDDESLQCNEVVVRGDSGDGKMKEQ